MKKSLALAGLLLSIALAGCSHPRPYYPPPPPPMLTQIARMGFYDGVRAAQRDISRGRPFAAARHQRFRRPPVPPPGFEEYRFGFRRGYEQVFHQGPPPPAVQ